MTVSSRFAHSQRKTIMNGILVIVLILVILQLWLLVATMNAYLAGETTILVPALLASIVCLALNAGLLRYVLALD